MNNFFFSPVSQNDTDQIDTRVDHNFTQKHRLFGRYSRRRTDRVNPGALPLPADGGAWATDIYVQKVQDRARRKAAINARQSS